MAQPNPKFPIPMRDFLKEWAGKQSIPSDQVDRVVDEVMVPFTIELLKSIGWDGWWDPTSHTYRTDFLYTNAKTRVF